LRFSVARKTWLCAFILQVCKRLPKISQVRYGAMRKVELPPEKKLKQASLLQVLKLRNKKAEKCFPAVKNTSLDGMSLKRMEMETVTQGSINSCHEYNQGLKHKNVHVDNTRKNELAFSLSFGCSTTSCDGVIDDNDKSLQGTKDKFENCNEDNCKSPSRTLFLCSTGDSGKDLAPRNTQSNYLGSSCGKNNVRGVGKVLVRKKSPSKATATMECISSEVKSCIAKCSQLDENPEINSFSCQSHFTHIDSLGLLREQAGTRREPDTNYDMTLKYVPDSQGNLVFDYISEKSCEISLDIDKDFCAQHNTQERSATKNSQSLKIEPFGDSLGTNESQATSVDKTSETYDMTMRYELDSQGDRVFHYLSQNEKRNFDEETPSESVGNFHADSVYLQFRNGIQSCCHSTQKL